ncbi:hypothetical protein RUM44_000404 [Polyplax serrata]|uniref:Dynein axonemal assembly factor 1 homolog n=1 Tax=Polyplax serrata TaxID=468196 RepID=A0ABR1B5C2_POLSC
MVAVAFTPLPNFLLPRPTEIFKNGVLGLRSAVTGFNYLANDVHKNKKTMAIAGGRRRGTKKPKVKNVQAVPIKITKESLRQICKEHKLYMTPHLNDVLYLHYKGYSKIENLEEYTGLKCLWLENNGIDKIENLDNQKDLRSLYLHHNLIKEIENLEDSCPLLDSLNLCHNSVSMIKNLSKLECLHTLHISHNRLHEFSDIEHLKHCKELSCVDLQHNWLDDPNIVDIFEAMPSLRVLYLTGNPVIKKIPSYRKNLTIRCKNLTYLDDRPVFPKDRAAAEAWSVGGIEAEKACRQRWAEEERAKIDASVRGILATLLYCLMALRNDSKIRKEMERLEVEMVGETTNNGDSLSEESDEDSEASLGNLQAGDSEEITTHNGIIFPWDLERNARPLAGNELGDGGRSLIVELPDSNQTEVKPTKSVKRNALNDPETKNKLHEALLSAEWLKETQAETGGEVKEDVQSTEVVRNPQEEPDNEKNVQETVSTPDTEMEYKKYMKKAEDEILPNISHFEFGREAKTEEKSLSREIEDMLRTEMEESLRSKNGDVNDKNKLIEEIENGSGVPKLVRLNEREENNAVNGKRVDFVKIEITEEPKEEQVEGTLTLLQSSNKEEVPTVLEKGDVDSAHFDIKKIVQGELNEIINRVVSSVFLHDTELIDEKEANQILNNGINVVNVLNDIGKLPLNERSQSQAQSQESDNSEERINQEEQEESQMAPQIIEKGREDDSSDEEFLDVEESEEFSYQTTFVIQSECEDVRQEEKIEIDEFHSLLLDDDQLSGVEETSPAITRNRNIKSTLELQVATEEDDEGVEENEICEHEN